MLRKEGRRVRGTIEARRKEGKAGEERGRLGQVREAGKSMVQRKRDTTELEEKNQKMLEAALSSIPG